MQEFAIHNEAIAKRLEEDEDTGEQKYTYKRSGPDHFAMAFTYAVLAWERDDPSRGRWLVLDDDEVRWL